jgi:hypothetical protein
MFGTLDIKQIFWVQQIHKNPRLETQNLHVL